MTDISKEAVERLAGCYGKRPQDGNEISIRTVTQDTLRAQAAHIAAQDAKIAKLVEALRGVTHSLDNRMIGLEEARQKAAQALASIGETDD